MKILGYEVIEEMFPNGNVWVEKVIEVNGKIEEREQYSNVYVHGKFPNWFASEKEANDYAKTLGKSVI